MGICIAPKARGAAKEINMKNEYKGKNIAVRVMRIVKRSFAAVMFRYCTPKTIKNPARVIKKKMAPVPASLSTAIC